MPMLFDDIRECQTGYIAVPKVSSETRRYVPMDYLSADIIAGDMLFVVQNTSLYHFGVMTSNVHMAWMRAVAGRLKSDYRYSSTMVYNTFPWPDPTSEQQSAIEIAAEAILAARRKYPDATLADLYGEAMLLYRDLLEAHRANDRAVMRAYGFSTKLSESECVAELMKRYERLVQADT